MEYKIGIVGHFGGDKSFLDGQTIKTRILFDELIKRLSKQRVFKLDTYRWTKKPFKSLISSIRIAIKSDVILINTSQRGRNIYIPLFVSLRKIFKTKVYCMVIGGGFPKQMEINKRVSKYAKRLDGIFVETNTMLSDLKTLDYKNAYLLNNFKNLKIVKDEDLNYNHSLPLKICTFSRVVKEKGIEDIINAVIKVNDYEKKKVYKLDIYGQIDNKYKEQFEDQIENTPDYINYKGMINYNDSVNVIKDYYMLIFPTLYKTEGVPGTIIDAYAAGVPVIVSNWDSCNDVVINNKTGIVFDMGDVDDLVSKLKEAYNNIDKINNMKTNCTIKAQEFTTKRVIQQLIQKLEKDLRE